MIAAAPILVDQALFGYADGHRQLASSLGLSARDSYELAARSDLVPGAQLEQDTSYLTGFTLAESGAFAFIRTWPAPEMPRPGCVWSHVLLLPKSFLSRQVDLGILSGQFCRPNRGRSPAGYGEKLVLDGRPPTLPAKPVLVSEILLAYYSSSDVGTKHPPDAEFERSLLAVWSQQWPRLRSEFAFRTMFGTTVSLDKALVIRVSEVPHTPPSISGRSDWHVDAREDAVAGAVTPLRRFLWRYGKDTAQPRRSFVNLVELYALTKTAGRRPSLKDLEWLVKSKDPKHGTTLKLDLLGMSATALSLAPLIEASDYARFLAMVRPIERHVAAAKDLNDALARMDQAELVTIAVTLGEVQATSVDLRTLWEGIVQHSGHEAIQHPDLPVAMAFQMLLKNPRFIVDYDVNKLDIMDADRLLGADLEADARTKLIGRILQEPAVEQMVPSILSEGAAALKTATALSMTDHLDASWAAALTDGRRTLLAGGLGEMSGIAEVSQAIRLLGFPLGTPIPASGWARAAEGNGSVGEFDDVTVIAAFVFVLCKHEGLASNMALAGHYLNHLRSAAVLNTIPHGARAFLEQHLPHTSENWDINKRLLKVLRTAARGGADVSDALDHLSLTQEETAYVMDWEVERQKFDVSALLRFFRN